MSPAWHPYREPVRTTLTRTLTIAVILGAVFTIATRGGLSRWPGAIVLMLWPALGGHFVELFFLNWLRPRIPDGRAIQVLARLVVWFVGGILLLMGMHLTAQMMGRTGALRWPWWVGGLGFIGVELIAHLGLRLRGRPNVYDGRG